LNGMNKNIDVIVPRGGKSLVAEVEKEAKVPVFGHLEGICHIYIDAMIEAPDTLGRLVGEEAYAQLLAAKANGKDEMVIPEKVADTYYHIAHQHRSAWTSEVDIRPFTEQPWWND
ncbi:MAG: hypothetical protein VXV87_05045, partial [Pseudomonadota bacterium]|nr:hypothetical protein [Pseudomonadota bacterium]